MLALLQDECQVFRNANRTVGVDVARQISVGRRRLPRLSVRHSDRPAGGSGVFAPRDRTGVLRLLERLKRRDAKILIAEKRFPLSLLLMGMRGDREVVRILKEAGAKE